MSRTPATDRLDRRMAGHRGPDPEDARLFGPAALGPLRAAVTDVSWLLTRGYADTAALRVAGDHYQLTERQRRAVGRAACADDALERRRARRIAFRGQPLHVDGLNVLIGLERALGGGPVFRGRDGAIRDLGGIHGTFRLVEETAASLVHLAGVTGDAPLTWLVDRPVSNSGRLAALVRDVAAARGLPWQVDVVDRVDGLLAESGAAVASGDGWILERCAGWVDLVGDVLARAVPGAWVVDLGVAEGPGVE